MKRNIFVRAVALLLVSCLIADPALAQVRSQKSEVKNSISDFCALPSDLFVRQALAARVTGAFRSSGKGNHHPEIELARLAAYAARPSNLLAQSQEVQVGAELTLGKATLPADKKSYYQQLFENGKAQFFILPDVPPWYLPQPRIKQLKILLDGPWAFTKEIFVSLFKPAWWADTFRSSPDPLGFVSGASYPVIVTIAAGYWAPWTIKRRIQEAARRGAKGILAVSGGHPLIQAARKIPLLSWLVPDSLTVLRLVREMREELPLDFEIWAVANPNKKAVKEEVARMAEKMGLEAQAIFLQPFFHPERSQEWLELANQAGPLQKIPLIAGIPLIASPDNLDFWLFQLVGLRPGDPAVHALREQFKTEWEKGKESFNAFTKSWSDSMGQEALAQRGIEGIYLMPFLHWRDLDEVIENILANPPAAAPGGRSPGQSRASERTRGAGAAGFIGKALAARFANDSGRQVIGGLLEREALQRAVESAAVIYHVEDVGHMAGEQADDLERQVAILDANPQSAAFLRALADRQPKPPRIVYLSSQRVYEAGGVEGHVREDDPLPYFSPNPQEAFAVFVVRFLSHYSSKDLPDFTGRYAPIRSDTPPRVVRNLQQWIQQAEAKWLKKTRHVAERETKLYKFVRRELHRRPLQEDLLMWLEPVAGEWLKAAEEDFRSFAQRSLSGETDQERRAHVREFLEAHPVPKQLEESLFAVSLYLGERLAAGNDCVVVRSAHVYGPNDPSNRKINQISRAVLAGEPLVSHTAMWPDSGRYLYIDDLVEICAWLGSLERLPKSLVQSKGILNVAGPGLAEHPEQAIRNDELVPLVEGIAGTSPISVEWAVDRSERRLELDTGQLHGLLGRGFRFTPLEEGLRRTIVWMRGEQVRREGGLVGTAPDPAAAPRGPVLESPQDSAESLRRRAA